MVVRDSPTVDVAYEHQPSVLDDESTASAKAAIAQVVAQPRGARHTKAKWRRCPTVFVCMSLRWIHPYCPRGTLYVIFSPRCVNNPRTALLGPHPDLVNNFPISILPNSKCNSLSENARSSFLLLTLCTLNFVLNVGHVRPEHPVIGCFFKLPQEEKNGE